VNTHLGFFLFGLTFCISKENYTTTHSNQILLKTDDKENIKILKAAITNKHYKVC
jgi:hypothetical protein